jgi:hypothetical protein
VVLVATGDAALELTLKQCLASVEKIHLCMRRKAACRRSLPRTTAARLFGVGHHVRHNPRLRANGHSVHWDSPFAMRGEGFAEARKVRAVREENTQELCEAASI